MAANADILNAIQTLTQQLNGIGDRLQDLEIRDTVSPEQFGQRAIELRNHTEAAVSELKQAVANLQMRGADSQPSSDRYRLMNDKEDKPQHFGAEKNDHLHFRSWSKKIINYLNGRRRGFRGVLEWARDQGQRVISTQEVFASEWNDRQDGNALLYGFWLKILHGEALLIVEQAVDNGLDGFRMLHQKFDPRGAQHDLERYHQLTHGVKPARSLQDLPRVIVAWEAELKEFQRKANDFPIPEKIKIAVMLNLLPTDYAKDMRKDYHKAPKGYDALREIILEYTRLETGICPPMNIDTLGHDDYRFPETEPNPPETEPGEKWTYDEFANWYGEATVDALWQGGKSKGKGKGAFPGKGKGKGKDDPNAASQPRPFAGKCNACGKVGHKWFECPDLKKQYGKGKGKGTASLDQDPQDGMLGHQRDCGGLDCGSLDNPGYESDFCPTCPPDVLGLSDEEGEESEEESASSSTESTGRRVARMAIAATEEFVDTDSGEEEDDEGYETPRRTARTMPNESIPASSGQAQRNSFAPLSESAPRSSPPTAKSLVESMREEQMRNPILRMALLAEKGLQMPMSFAAAPRDAPSPPPGMVGDVQTFYGPKKNRKERKAKAPKKKKAKIVTSTIATQTEVNLRHTVPVERWIPVVGFHEVIVESMAAVEKTMANQTEVESEGEIADLPGITDAEIEQDVMGIDNLDMCDDECNDLSEIAWSAWSGPRTARSSATAIPRPRARTTASSRMRRMACLSQRGTQRENHCASRKLRPSKKSPPTRSSSSQAC